MPVPVEKFNSILVRLNSQSPGMIGMNRAIFFDRDGTLIAEKNYLCRPEDVVVFPGACAALRRLAAAGFQLFIVSNQSGVGRGYFTLGRR